MGLKSVVLITGAGRGLGQSMALAFAKRNYRVGINFSRSRKEAVETAELVRRAGGKALLLPGDVSEADDIKKIVSTVANQWGRIDVLINNAGIARNAFVSKMTEAQWDEVMKVNLKGPFLCSRAAILVMRRQKGGSIWNIGSYLARRPGVGVANYAVAKAGLVALTKAIAAEEGRFNIRANVVLPGFHVTDLNKDLWPKIEKEIRGQHLVEALAKAEDLGEFIFHLSQFPNLTGQEFAFEGRLQ